jgi:hypothetical protein
VSTDPLLLTMLAVSCASLLLQSAAFLHLRRQRASYDAERRAGHGYVRTAACRVLAACIYTAVAALAVAGERIPGAGVLGPEALVVFSLVQIIWLSNSAMDIRVRQLLRRKRGSNLSADAERLSKP